jgi:hypothetical protein
LYKIGEGKSRPSFYLPTFTLTRRNRGEVLGKVRKVFLRVVFGGRGKELGRIKGIWEAVASEILRGKGVMRRR